MANTTVGLTRSKFCPCCKGTKPISCFGRNRQAKDGLHYYCKTCAAAKQRKWARDHPAVVRAMRTEYLNRIRARNAERDPYEDEMVAA